MQGEDRSTMFPMLSPLPGALAPARTRRRALSLAVLISCVLPACSSKGDDTAAESSNDADQDGVPAGQDCNDSDASVAPGATEIWYDGVDSDCGGDDDFDADADGFRSDAFGGNDCNDSDAAVNPAATEVWYDAAGVDSNCDGWNDGDADFDGQPAVDVGGTDCDDTNPAIYRGAPETWYDGVDSNCDGDDDYDADQDGVVAALYAEDGEDQDCNDNDPDVWPGAEETWYDGIDSDCDEADDYDADGDGEASLDHAPAGAGTDCDDTDPTIRTSTVEALDGRDTDCDGVKDTFSADQDFGQGWILGVQSGHAFGSAVAAGDFDEDGRADIAAIQATDDGISDLGDGLVYVFEGADLGTSATDASIAVSRIRSDPFSGQLTDVAFLLDVDGPDNKRELAISGPDAINGSGDMVGSVWIFKHNLLSISASYKVNTNASWILTGRTPAPDPTEFGTTVRSVDVDDDGLADVLVGAPGADGGEVFLFTADTLDASAVLVAGDADASWVGPNDGDELGKGIGTFDVNGDGHGDMVFGAPGYNNAAGRSWVVLGTATPTGGAVSSAAFATLDHPATNSRFGHSIAAGDFDGDGDPDLAVGAPRAVTRAGKVYVILNSSLVGGGSLSATSDAYVTHTGTDIDGLASSVVHAGDVNADGSDDLFLGGPGNDDGGDNSGAAWMVVSGLRGDRALANADATLYGGAPDDGLGGALATGDVDGDGRSDLVFGVPGEDVFGNEGSVYIGFSRYAAP